MMGKKGFVGFFLVVCLMQTVFASNYRSGLHLQLPSHTIDIKRSDMEDVQTFHTTPNAAAALIRLSTPLAEKVYKLTSKEVGKQMLIVWNGRVVGVQKLDSPINEFLNVPNLTAFEAEDLNKK